MRITQEMVEEAITKFKNRYDSIALIDLSPFMCSEFADLLTSIATEDITYDLIINTSEFGVVTLADVVSTLKEHAKPGDNIHVEIHETRDFDEIGSAKWTFGVDGEFVHPVTSFGAGIGLHEKANELAQQSTQTQA